MTQRTIPRQQRSQETVDRILEAANVEIAACGSAATTTTAIAARAGVSVGALYRFFPDKHAIGDALAERYLSSAVARFEPAITGAVALGDVPEMIRAVIRSAAELQLEHGGYYRLTQEVRPDQEASPGHAVRRAMVEAFDSRLVELGATGPTGARRVALELVIETIRHTLVVCPPSGPTRRAMLDELTDMVVTYAERRLA